MTTFAQFFGCELSNPDSLIRDINDTNPIQFEWSLPATAITAEVAFDNVTFVETIGSVFNPTGNIWQLSYDPQDRPTVPSLITYRFTDNNSNQQTVTLQLTGALASQTLPEQQFSEYGPKRIKTREMEIEQFDIEKLDRLKQRSSNNNPSFCQSTFCVGYYDSTRPHNDK